MFGALATSLMELYRRTQSEGVDATAVDAAMDSDSAKADIVQLLLDSRAALERSQRADELGALRAELSGLRVMALHKRAEAAGVGSALIEDAMDGEAPKADLVALILARL